MIVVYQIRKFCGQNGIKKIAQKAPGCIIFVIPPFISSIIKVSLQAKKSNQNNQMVWPLFLLFFSITTSTHIQIPLAYAFSQQLQSKYPIELSFQTSQTFTPYPTDTLYLYNANISLQTEQLRTSDSSVGKVIIGLKYPSEFVRAVSEYFKVPENEIEFGKQEFLKLIINDLSFIQSQDILVNHGFYSIKSTYNFGEPIQISNEQIQVFDGNTIYWNQILIRRILTNLKDQNDITYKMNEHSHTIQLQGKLQNFPQIAIMSGTYLFKIDTQKMLKDKQLNYIAQSQYDIYSSSKQATKIGLGLLSDFSKFQIDQGKIVFKRTSQLFLLYLFLAYYFGICFFIIVINRNDNFKTMEFVRNIVSWVMWKDNAARIQVLRTELE